MENSSNNSRKTLNRRDFLKITGIAGVTLGLGTTLTRKLSESHRLSKVTETHYLMGTIVNFAVITPDETLGREAIRKTIKEMSRLIGIFDYRNPATALARLNQNGSITEAPTELLEIVQRSLEFGRLSHGAFDISVLPIVQAYKAGQTNPARLLELVDYRKIILDGNNIRFTHPGMSITLDGIAKGRVVDAGVDVLKNAGFENVLVEAGGDMMASSTDVDGEGWKIAVSNPRPDRGTEFVASFTVKNRAVTTSGDYQNYFSPDYSSYHIIDPRTGVSPFELSSATVMAASAAEADGLSTTLMVLGVSEGLRFIQSLPDVEALLITKNLKIFRSAGFPVNH
jgi:FAD:protein FMN transferase